MNSSRTKMPVAHGKTLPARLLLSFGVLLLCAGIALGQSDSDNAGSQEVRESYAVGDPLPNSEPIPLPEVSDAVARSAVDPAATLKAAGSQIKKRTGELQSEPPSEAVAELMENPGPRPQGGKAVWGSDDRERINDATAFPFRAVGVLFSEAADRSGWGSCSATLIGPRTVITAAHCVHDAEAGGWATEIFFVPGSNSSDDEPFGRYYYDEVSIQQGYIDFWEGEYTSAVVPYDLAVVTLREAAGDVVGWFGYRTDDASGFSAHILGYPSDKPNQTLWRSDCEMPQDAFDDLTIAHYCDTFYGSSGSSIYVQDADGSRYVRAINVAHNSSSNVAVRLVPHYFEWVREVKSQAQ